MFNKLFARSVLSIAAVIAVAVPAANAQAVPNRLPIGVNSQPAADVYLNRAVTASVTFFDNDPMGSSRRLGRAQVALPAGDEVTLRRAIRAVAPAGAQWARVRTPRGRIFLIQIRGTRHLLNPRR